MVFSGAACLFLSGKRRAHCWSFSGLRSSTCSRVTAKSRFYLSSSTHLHLTTLSCPSLDRRWWDDGRGILGREHRTQQAHEAAIEKLRENWAHNSECLAAFLQVPANKIRYLEVDVSNAYCQIGCCRLAYDGYDVLISRLEPSNVTFLGSKDKEYEAKFLAEIALQWEHDRGESDTQSYEAIATMLNIQFDPKDDSWEQWKIEGPTV